VILSGQIILKLFICQQDISAQTPFTFHTQPSETVNKEHCVQGVIVDINEIIQENNHILNGSHTYPVELLDWASHRQQFGKVSEHSVHGFNISR
jgi:hypothetical protein